MMGLECLGEQVVLEFDRGRVEVLGDVDGGLLFGERLAICGRIHYVVVVIVLN